MKMETGDKEPLPPRCSGKFRVERHLGSGGFGTAYLARQIALDRPAVVKLLHSQTLKDPDLVARFIQEAKTTARIQHPHVVSIYDFDVEDGCPWIAYEYLAGESLAAALKGRSLDLKESLEMILQVLSALQEAHRHGVVHRDIKPSNVIGAGTGIWKVIDFGIARWSSSRGVKTQAGVVFGTPEYMAPELLLGNVATPQSDIYAAGVVLHEALTGRPPFSALDLPSLIRLVRDAPPPELRESLPGTPPILDGFLQRLLAKDPADRYPRALDAFEEISALARERVQGGTLQVPVRPRTTRVSPKVTTRLIPPAAPETVKKPGSSGVSWKVLLIAGVAGVLALASSSLRSPLRERPLPPTPIQGNVKIKELTFLDGSLKITLESVPPALISTHVLSVPTPTRYPVIINITSFFAPGASTKETPVIQAGDASRALLAQTARVPLTIQKLFLLELGSSPGIRAMDRAEMARALDRGLRESGLAFAAAILKDHAGALFEDGSQSRHLILLRERIHQIAVLQTILERYPITEKLGIVGTPELVGSYQVRSPAPPGKARSPVSFPPLNLGEVPFAFEMSRMAVEVRMDCQAGSLGWFRYGYMPWGERTTKKILTPTMAVDLVGRFTLPTRVPAGRARLHVRLLPHPLNFIQIHLNDVPLALLAPRPDPSFDPARDKETVAQDLEIDVDPRGLMPGQNRITFRGIDTLLTDLFRDFSVVCDARLEMGL